MARYYLLSELVSFIDRPNNGHCATILAENKQLFETARGSATKHQAWEGGYLDHIVEIMNIAVVLYDALNPCRALVFSLSDTLLTLFLHDLEKPWVYAKDSSKRVVLKSEAERKKFVDDKIKQYGFVLTKTHRNAIRYVHGENEDYDPKVRVQTPLGAFIHHCDNTSARIWFDHPLEKNDSWSNRIRG